MAKTIEQKRAEAVARNMKHKARYVKESMVLLGFKEGQELNAAQQQSLDLLVNHKIGIPRQRVQS